MSVFHMSPKDMNESLAKLPSKHTKDEVLAMVAKLQNDLAAEEDGSAEEGSTSLQHRVHAHANNHKELFFSYPMLFRSVCKGTYRPVVLDIIWEARTAIENGAKTKKEALEEVIRQSVDEVNEFRKTHPR
jgi:hypothetical protein